MGGVGSRTTASAVRARRGERRRSLTGRLLRATLYAFLAFYGLGALGLVYLRFFPPLITTVQIQRWIEADDGAGSIQYTFVPRDRIADHLARAVLASEDSRFFDHHGFDWIEVERALEQSQQRHHVTRGASTITQQLVKNLFLTTHRSVVRKVLEVPLVWLAEHILPKQRILELYLNVVEWGPRVFGAEAAAHYHYGVSAARLSEEQAARLAAILPAPRTRHPQHMSAAAARILQRMRDGTALKSTR